MSCYFKSAFFSVYFQWLFRLAGLFDFHQEQKNQLLFPTLKQYLYSPFSWLQQFKQHALSENTGKEKTSNLDNVHAVDWCLNVYASFFISTVNFENESRKSAIYIDETSLSTSNLNFTFIMFVKTQFVKRLFSKSQIGFGIQ